MLFFDFVSQYYCLIIFVDWFYDYLIYFCDFLVVGFYYLGKNDFVRCFKCDILLYNWDFDDILWGEYKRWFFQCLLVLENECYNEDYILGQNVIV